MDKQATRGEENRELKLQGKRRCATCKEIKSLSEFAFRNFEKTQVYSCCRKCKTTSSKTIQQRNRNLYYCRKRDKEWSSLLDNLGHTCDCCGEANEAFLTVDHINRDGHKEAVLYMSIKYGELRRLRRNGLSLWRKARLEGYPKDKYRMLCYNCNCGRERNEGVCPHVNEPIPLGLCG